MVAPERLTAGSSVRESCLYSIVCPAWDLGMQACTGGCNQRVRLQAGCHHRAERTRQVET